MVAARNQRERGVARAVAALAAPYALAAEQREQLTRLIELLVDDPLAPTSARTLDAALDDHVADSLAGLECERLRSANSVLDLGSGAGLPGLPLAIAMPQSSFTLLESSSRKVKFLDRAIESCRVANASAMHARAESFAARGDRFDAVTARAVAPLPTVLEYAAPLLRPRGTVVVWRGRREPDSEAAAEIAAAALGLGAPVIQDVQPYPGVRERHLYAVVKVTETPSRYPRRPGMALKRPLGMESRNRPASDRIRR